MGGWDRNRSVNAFATTVSREWTFTDPAAGQIYISTPHRIGSTHEDAGENLENSCKHCLDLATNDKRCLWQDMPVI